MSYITTYTGKHFDPKNPDVTYVDVVDIAHALSLLCRGNGHVKTFFSVGQHCIACAKEAQARGYDQRIVLACLLHDASEAYMSDVPRPFKEALAHYIEAEERLLDQIYKKFLGTSLNDEEKKIIKQIDDDLLYYDLRDLLGECQDEAAPKLATAFTHEVQSFEDVEKEYLRLYDRWKIV